MSIWWAVGAFLLGFYAGWLALALMNVAAAGERAMAAGADEAGEAQRLDPVTREISLSPTEG